MFTRDPFNIAPQARRHTRASWSLLGAGLLFALLGAGLLQHEWQQYDLAQETAESNRALLKAQQRHAAAARARQAEPAALEKLKAQRELQRMLRMSWSGLFDALESAGKQVGGRATLVSLTPVKARADALEFGITALAASNFALVEYMRALESHAQVRHVELSSQQPARVGGSEAVRFQLTVVWAPQAPADAASNSERPAQ